MFCSQCGAQISAASKFCTKCGAPQQPPPQARTEAAAASGRKNPVLAVVLSLVPGLGEIYCGRYTRGLAILILYIIFVAIFLLTAQVDWYGNVYYNYWLLVPGWILFCIGAYDSYNLAKGVDVFSKVRAV
jgi:TM2 domain-containing membrane protein YozV